MHSFAWQYCRDQVWPSNDHFSVWGISIRWTDDHLSDGRREHLKLSWDKQGDLIRDLLQESVKPSAHDVSPAHAMKHQLSKNSSVSQDTRTVTLHNRLQSWIAKETHCSNGGSLDQESSTVPQASHQDGGSVKETHPPDSVEDTHVDEQLHEMWLQISSVPTWVDWKQIQRGMDVFHRYSGPLLVGMAYQSLIGGMGMSGAVETLTRTSGFSVKNARKRVYETAQFILQTSRSIDGMKPGGEGFVACLRVRLLHAVVRQRILILAASHPGYYDQARYGVPINDLDSIGTICSFSSNLIFDALPRQGLFMLTDEIEDLTALWRLIAFYMGTPTDYLATPVKSRAMMETLLAKEVKPSRTGMILAQNIVTSLANQPPAYLSEDFIIAETRWLAGNELSDALELRRVSWYYKLLVLGQCVFFSSWCYTYRYLLPRSWDRKRIDRTRQILWTVLVDSKMGLGKPAVFDFVYIPAVGKLTQVGKVEDQNITSKSNVERRNAISLIIATVLAVGLLYLLRNAATHLIYGVAGVLRYGFG